MKRDNISDEIMEYGRGEFVQERDEIRDREQKYHDYLLQIKGLTEKIKVVKHHIKET